MRDRIVLRGAKIIGGVKKNVPFLVARELAIVLGRRLIHVTPHVVLVIMVLHVWPQKVAQHILPDMKNVPKLCAQMILVMALAMFQLGLHIVVRSDIMVPQPMERLGVRVVHRLVGYMVRRPQEAVQLHRVI